MSPPQQLRQQTSNCSSLFVYRPQKDERLSWPSWLTYSGRLTHISGHPSATSRAQDSESTSAKDQCSTAGPTQPTRDIILPVPVRLHRSRIPGTILGRLGCWRPPCPGTSRTVLHRPVDRHSRPGTGGDHRGDHDGDVDDRVLRRILLGAQPASATATTTRAGSA